MSALFYLPFIIYLIVILLTLNFGIYSYANVLAKFHYAINIAGRINFRFWTHKSQNYKLKSQHSVFRINQEFKIWKLFQSSNSNGQIQRRYLQRNSAQTVFCLQHRRTQQPSAFLHQHLPRQRLHGIRWWPPQVTHSLFRSRIQNLPNYKKTNLGENIQFIVVFQTIEIERLSS